MLRRPTFDHIDEAEKRKQEKLKGAKAADAEFKQVNTRLARIESERAQAVGLYLDFTGGSQVDVFTTQ
jgi:predicted nuclease with TOPRIM domain